MKALYEGVGFCSFSEYEELADYEEQPMMTQEETIKGWVAVDKDTTGRRRVTLFPNKPVRDVLTDFHYWAATRPYYESIRLDSNHFKDMTWEDEPVEAEITIKIKR